MHSVLNEPFTPMRMIYATWMLSGIVLSNTLSSIFSSTLAYPEYEPAIDTVQDISHIASSNTHYLLTKDQTTLYSSFMNAQPSDGVYYQIGEHIRRNKQQMVEKSDELVATVESDKRFVVIAMKINLMANRFLRATKPLHISGESLGPVHISLAMPKRSPLMDAFNAV